MAAPTPTGGPQHVHSASHQEDENELTLIDINRYARFSGYFDHAMIRANAARGPIRLADVKKSDLDLLCRLSATGLSLADQDRLAKLEFAETCFLFNAANKYLFEEAKTHLRLHLSQTYRATHYTEEDYRGAIDVLKSFAGTELDVEVESMTIQWICNAIDFFALQDFPGNEGIMQELFQLLQNSGMSPLSLRFQHLQDKHLEFVSKLADLEELTLAGCPVSAPGMAHLARLPRLLRLDLSSCLAVDDQAVHHVSQIPTLRSLTLCDCLISDLALFHLIPRQTLTSLTLKNCPNLTSISLLFLCQMPQLRRLLYCCSFVSDFSTHFFALANAMEAKIGLQMFTYWDAIISDENYRTRPPLMLLKKLTQLEYLNINDCRPLQLYNSQSRDAHLIEELQLALPNTLIESGLLHYLEPQGSPLGSPLGSGLTF